MNYELKMREEIRYSKIRLDFMVGVQALAFHY